MSKAQMDAARRGGVSWGMADDAALEEDLDNVTEGAHSSQLLFVSCLLLLCCFLVTIAFAVLGCGATSSFRRFLAVFPFIFLFLSVVLHVQQVHQQYAYRHI